MYTVTRQLQWPEGRRVVEVSSGGRDYTNPDALAARYRGEFEEFLDPVEAVETAIEICRAWCRDTRKRCGVAVGATGGMTMPFEPRTFAVLRAWAKKRRAQLPRCDRCGELLPERPYCLFDFDDLKFCREYCAEAYYEANLLEESA